MAVPRCPVCHSERVIILVSPKRRAFCSKCGTKWVPVGAGRQEIEPNRVAPEHPSVKGRRKSR